VGFEIGAIDGNFKCAHCGNQVVFDPLVSGVHNRNHCPFCLWSKHVDEKSAGDRLATCKGQMQPVGLTLKRVKKKYGDPYGELMLIHACVECGKISINRIAADDNTDRILDLLAASASLDPETRAAVESDDIEILGPDDEEIVRTRLFGKVS
jgi:hypothetical protein